MASFPKIPYRKTDHKPAKYQLYQVGFNPSKSCWLGGSWVTVTKAEYDKRKASVAKEYAHVRKHTETQHHRDKSTAIKDVEMRTKLKSAISNFDEAYLDAQKNHNECERENLDNSEGTLYCWVLPKFHDDGSHESVGERDAPWGHKPKKPRKKATGATLNGVA